MLVWPFYLSKNDVPQIYDDDNNEERDQFWHFHVIYNKDDDGYPIWRIMMFFISITNTTN